jgi:hypothetical protein
MLASAKLALPKPLSQPFPAPNAIGSITSQLPDYAKRTRDALTARMKQQK